VEAARLEDLNGELVHVHDATVAPETLAALERSNRVVVTLHNLNFGCSAGTRYFRGNTICTRAHGPGCLGNAVFRGCAHRLDLRPMLGRYRRIEQQLPLLRAAPAVVVHSEYMRGLAVANGVLRERCHRAYLFVERPAEPAPPPNEERIVSFVGRVVENKGLDVLIRALAACEARWDRLVVAGDGWYAPRARQLAERLGVAGKLELSGWRSQDEVRALLRRSTLLAAPARWPEPFGLAGIEAMAQARPVVASRAGGMPEWLADGETGLLVAPGDVAGLAAALGRLLDDGALAASLGRAGWERVAEFSLERHLAALDDAYRAAQA
jgi:glycosyltransferase involved in cell wall biosynthesis